MSLHGPIHVNDARIGYWCATRVLTGDPNVYDCWVDVNFIRNEFQITHRYEDGAAALASKVLAEWSVQERKKHE